MKTVLLAIVALGLLAGLLIALAHTDTGTVIQPPLTPVTVPYGDRQQ